MKQQTICYVLNTFPQPSETFIVDEIDSLREFGVAALVLRLGHGESSTEHPAAQWLRDAETVRTLDNVRRIDSAAAWVQLILRRPRQAALGLIVALRSADRWRLFQVLPAALWCARSGVTYLHAHFAHTSLLYADAISVWTGIPFGVTTHGYDLREDPLPRDVARRLFLRADRLITISEFNRRVMVEKYGLDPSTIHIVRCGISLARFPFLADKPFGFHPARLLNVGRLVHVKGQDILLRALALVHKRGIVCNLTIVGGGTLKTSLADLVVELNLEQHVRFLGVCPQPIVLQELRVADLFVLSSRSEGLPVACIEAMAVGTPVIAPRITGIPELIETGVTGILVEPEDPLMLANAICFAITNRELLTSIRSAARRAVEARFERIDCTRQLLERIAHE